MWIRPAEVAAVATLVTRSPAAAECVWGNCENGRGTLRHPDGSLETGVWQDGKLIVSKGRSKAVAPARQERPVPRKARAARSLGMSFRSFRYFARKYGLSGGRETATGPSDE